MKKIAIINLKGGVAKTTTAANFAANLVKSNYRVLLVDCDKQGNLTRLLRCLNGYTLTDVLLAKCSAAEATRKTAYANLDIIPADINLLDANQQITAPDCMGKALQDLDYDYCIFDCAPNIDMITLNVLACADEVIIPVKQDGFAEDGIRDILAQLDNIRVINPGIIFKGCLITISAGGIWMDDLYELLTAKYKVFKTIIPYTPKVPESTIQRQLLSEYSPRCGAAKAYKHFTAEYLEG